jgi:hypothetical protein
LWAEVCGQRSASDGCRTLTARASTNVHRCRPACSSTDLIDYRCANKCRRFLCRKMGLDPMDYRRDDCRFVSCCHHRSFFLRPNNNQLQLVSSDCNFFHFHLKIDTRQKNTNPDRLIASQHKKKAPTSK